MSRGSLFANPLFLGFEEIEQAFERLGKTASDGYPPYNVEQHSERHLRIVVAVAGFAAEELSLMLEGKQLTVRGKQASEEARSYLYRGIAARQFQRSFLLAEGIEVTGATLDHGLLTIDLERPLEKPEVRRIEITGAER